MSSEENEDDTAKTLCDTQEERLDHVASKKNLPEDYNVGNMINHLTLSRTP